MTLKISHDDARRFLTGYHLAQTDLPGVFDRLGTVQYDPLNPVGRNPDLVFQARVPGYQVDDWQRHAYGDRLIYDAWDKQACLVPTSDWPSRALIRERYRPWHDREVIDDHPEAVEAALAEIDRRGPLSSLEFEDRSRVSDGHFWLGPTRIKRILRALWCRGILVTHHREGVRHYYERPERVIPPEHIGAPPLLDDDAYHHWIVLRRHQAAGLLRPTANQEIWSVCGDPPTRARSIRTLVDTGELIPIKVGAKSTLFHMPANLLPHLEDRPLEPRMTFLAPLDNMLWDRKAIKDLFSFTYTWEVYKREADRVWGYYVLPVIYKDRFVARCDSRLEGKEWVISRWWWEEGVGLDVEILDALRRAAARFANYLRAEAVRVADTIDVRTRSALLGTSAVEE